MSYIFRFYETLGAEMRVRTRGPSGIVVLAITASVLAAIMLMALLAATNGTFGFTLDDPYIHLALSERILQGYYGLNTNEAASPSSSILYPFLIAPLVKVGLGQSAGFAVNYVALIGVMILLGALAAEAGIVLARVATVRLLGAALVGILGLNLIGLVFTGLEHTLHVADTLACLLGIVRTLRTGIMPRWLPVVLVLNPLIRFEGLSVWAAGAIVLGVERKYAAALWTIAAGLLLVGGYCWFLHSMGLPFLPSSVMAKSTEASSSGLFGTLINTVSTFQYNLRSYGAPQLLLTMALLLWGARNHPSRGVALFVGLTILAHFCAGAFGTLNRYEIYVLTLAWAAVLVVYGERCRRWLSGTWPAFVAGLVLWLGMHDGYARTTLLVPRAAAEIHLQQFQMHRFAVDYWRAPIAVNDLGWVAYDNPNYVLDLWGLGSEAARTSRMQGGNDPSWIQNLVVQHHVDAAMIYASWFPTLPADWTAVAELTLGSHATVAANQRKVTIYATTPTAIPELRDALTRFGQTLPSGVTLLLQ